MHATVRHLVARLADPEVATAKVIRWGCPVPFFGDVGVSKVATLGINPSNREFVDIEGNELDGSWRRFHTLRSLDLSDWSELNAQHLELIMDSCRAYFSRNPYDGWFRKLDYILSGAGISYYKPWANACHLDLVPYATACKWTELNQAQRSSLLRLGRDALGTVLRDSPVCLLILNGSAVVTQFQEIADVPLARHERRDWSLPRKVCSRVPGYAYSGTIRSLCGVRLGREVRVLGFNHNIQSSFGVTRCVMDSIRDWVASSAEEMLR
jgi:hypothetical protein